MMCFVLGFIGNYVLELFKRKRVKIEGFTKVGTYDSYVLPTGHRCYIMFQNMRNRGSEAK